MSVLNFFGKTFFHLLNIYYLCPYIISVFFLRIRKVGINWCATPLVISSKELARIEQ